MPAAPATKPYPHHGDNLALWELYGATGKSVVIRNRLVERYMPLVYRAAKLSRRAPLSQVGDRICDGSEGLLDAVEKYKPASGVPFQTYAWRRITGAILDGIRRLDVVGHRSRTRWDVPLVGQLDAAKDCRAPETDPAEVADRGNFLAAVLRCRLSPIERDIIELHYMQGVPLLTVARNHDRTPECISKIHRDLRCRLPTISWVAKAVA